MKEFVPQTVDPESSSEPGKQAGLQPEVASAGRGEAQTVAARAQHGSVSRRVFNNTLLNFLGQGVIVALTFFTAPYIIHRLGAELFGVIALVQVLAGFGSLMNLGIGRALTKHVSALYWKNDVHAINELFQTAWATCMICGVIGVLVLVVPEDAIGKLFFRGSTQIQSVVGFSIWMAALGLLSSMLLETVSAIPSALQRFNISNALSVLIAVVRYLGSVAALALGFSVRSVLIVNLSANVLGVGAFAVASRQLVPRLSFFPKFHRAAFGKLVAFSFPILVATISVVVVTRVDRLILAYFLPLAAVTFYTLPYTLAERAMIGVGNVTAVVFPFASELHSMKIPDKIHELYLGASRILIFITLPFTVILVALPGAILRVWLGPEYASQGAIALGLLAAATFLNALTAVPTVIALGVGRVWTQAAFSCFTMAINLVANLLLIPRYGINGAALGLLIPQVFMTPIFVAFVTRIIKFPFRRLLFKCLLPPFASAAVQGGVLLAFHEYASSLARVVILCVGSLCLYGLVSFFGMFTHEERRALLRMAGFSGPGIGPLLGKS